MDREVYYNNLAKYLERTYGARTFKICIDGGFTCPNRDGRCGTGGCIFCGERGAGEHIRRVSVSEQMQKYFSRERKAEKFIAYFQNFTNTYAPVEALKEKYDEAVNFDPRIAVLSVGTRPDCINEEVVRLLSSYRDRVDVWVELGLQTANDETARRINRGYDREEFTRAVKLLKAYGLPVIVHIMVGLPGEGEDDLRETVAFLNRHSIDGIKIHCVYVIEGTKLAQWYQIGGYVPITLRQYAESVCYVLTHISPEIVVHKITGDAPKELLLAPSWNVEKNAILDEIYSIMHQNAWKQGCFYQKKDEA